jgi:hypothetical protein
MPASLASDRSSFFRGGRLDRFERHLPLLRVESDDLIRHWALCLFIGWVPVIAISLVESTLRREPAGLLVPLELHARWLLAVPLLSAGELRIGTRIQSVLDHLAATGIVPDRAALDRAVYKASRLEGSGLSELSLLAVSMAMALPAIASSSSAGELWHEAVSLTLFRFLLLRFLFRWSLWSYLLLTISRLELRLAGAHPDRSGGLGILSGPSTDLAIVVFAISALYAAAWAAPVARGQASLSDLLNPVAVFVLSVLAIALGPFLPFAPICRRARIRSLFQYEAFAFQYSRSFHEKWIDGPAKDPLGSPDIQSLADLSGSFQVVESMRLLPFGLRTVLNLVLPALLPLLPLYLMSVPITEVMKRLIKVLV